MSTSSRARFVAPLTVLARCLYVPWAWPRVSSLLTLGCFFASFYAHDEETEAVVSASGKQYTGLRRVPQLSHVDSR